MAQVMVKTILWDNDGLLVDTEQLYFSATRDVLSEVGVEMTLDMFVRISLYSSHQKTTSYHLTINGVRD